MKKLLAGLASATILLSACNPVQEVKEFVQPKNEVIQIVINGKLLSFDVPPLINEGRTLVPLRGIFEALGAEVTFNEATCDVFVRKGNRTILMHTGGKTEQAAPHAVVDGEVFEMKTPAKVVNGRTLVPIRFVGEVLGADVQWIAENQTVRISSKDQKDDGLLEGLRIFDKDVPNTLIRKGYKFVGDIDNDLPHGKGVLLDYGLNAIYNGSWINGVPNGEGTMQLGNELFITGNFVNGYPATGKLYYDNKLQFEGSFYSSTKIKSGKLRVADGLVFKGDFTQEQTRANGVIYTDAGSKVFEGIIELNGRLLAGDFTYRQVE